MNARGGYRQRGRRKSYASQGLQTVLGSRLTQQLRQPERQLGTDGEQGPPLLRWEGAAEGRKSR